LMLTVHEMVDHDEEVVHRFKRHIRVFLASWVKPVCAARADSSTRNPEQLQKVVDYQGRLLARIPV
jgi:hypothetical protein